MIAEAQPFSTAERERFHALLTLAAESPFEGERENALTAAGRLAAQHGMSLDEAAMPEPPQPRRQPVFWTQTRTSRHSSSEYAGVVNLMEYFLQADKSRREQALRDAYARGLDGAERRARERPRRPAFRPNPTKLNPHTHARVLLSETTLPLKEIVSLTGLDIYEIVGMKLKMRPLSRLPVS